MADTENISLASLSPEEEMEKFGFKRSEMYETSLANTMGDPYDRHVFLCYKNHASWVARLEFSDADPLAKRLCSSYMSRRSRMPVKTRVTICEGGEGTGFEDGDALIFPDMLKYTGLNESNVESFVEEVLVGGKEWKHGDTTGLEGSHVFVCAHGSRDKRCGVCGPILIDELKRGVDSRGLGKQVFVSACSHIGGHKYAGNLIVFNPDDQGKIIGHWYGYVTPDDIPEILDQHIGKGIVLQKLLRGHMGQVSESVNKVFQASQVIASNETPSGCCQGVNGFSCCKDADPLVHNKATESNRFGSFENLPRYAAVAVAVAVVGLAVAHFFKRSL